MYNTVLTSTIQQRDSFIYILHMNIYVTADGDCSHEIKWCLLLGRKVLTNLDSILRSRHITLSTKVLLVKAVGSHRVGHDWSDLEMFIIYNIYIHGILQERILEWVAISSSKGSSPPRDQTRLLCLLYWQLGSLPLGSPTKNSYQ